MPFQEESVPLVMRKQFQIISKSGLQEVNIYLHNGESYLHNQIFCKGSANVKRKFNVLWFLCALLI